MLFLPFTFIVGLVLIGARVLLNTKGRLPSAIRHVLVKLNRSIELMRLPRIQIKSSADSIALQANTKNSPRAGILKQVHFAEVIATSSSDGSPTTTTTATAAATTKQANTHQQTLANKAPGKSGKSKNSKSNASEQARTKRDCIPEIEEFDIDSLVDMSSLHGKAGLSKRHHLNQQQLGKKQLGRKRHNSEGNYSSEQLFKMIAASCLSKEEVEMAVETLLNKLESGDAQWNQPKSDPLVKLKNQLRESESALATEAHNHEQARARLVELKQQLQSERNSKVQAVEEAASIKKEFGVVSAALEKLHGELSSQRSLQQRAEEERLSVISKLEQENSHLQNLLTNGANKSDEAKKLRLELEDKLDRLHRYELANDNLSKGNHELETRLRKAEIQFNELETSRRNSDYEACAKLAELEADNNALKKALKDHMTRLNELAAANSLLEKSLNDARVLNNQQDDIIKRLHEERRLNEASMQRALCEMESELRQLHEQLSSKTTISNERHQRELSQFEKELNDAGQREQKLTGKMRQLRDGLSELFPDLKANMVQSNSDDWVHKYLIALKQLSMTVDQLRNASNNNNNNNNNIIDENGSEHSNRSTPSKRSAQQTNGKSSRVGSPISNGRSSRASSNHDREKKLMETRLVEDLALFCLRCLD